MPNSIQSRLRDQNVRKTPVAAGLLLVCTFVVILQARWVSQNKELFRGTLDDTIASPNGARFVQCDICMRSGRVQRPGSQTAQLLCPVCFGVGGNYILIDDPELEKRCPTCNGVGRLIHDDRVTAKNCFLCQGRGVARIPPGYMVCPQCLGQGGKLSSESGEILPCWLCDERGFIMQDLKHFPQPEDDLKPES